MHFTFVYQVDDHQFRFDDAEVKAVLDGVPLTEPDVLRFVREMLEQGTAEVREAVNAYPS